MATADRRRSACSTAAAGPRADRRHPRRARARPRRRRADWPDWATRSCSSAACGARASRGPWAHQVAAAELARGRSVGGHRDRYGVGQVAGLPAARLTAVLDGAAGADGRGATVLYLSPDQGAGRRPAAGAARARRPPDVRAGDRTTATRPSRSATGCAQHATYVLTNPDMLHRSMLPGHARWAAFLRGAALRRRRRVPRLPRRLRLARRRGAAPAAAGLRALRRRPGVRAGVGDGRPTRRCRRGRLTGLPVVAVTDDALAARRDGVRAVGAAADRAAPASTAHRCAARRPPRPPTCSPTWSSRAPGRWPSCGRGAAPRRSRSTTRRAARRGRPRRSPARVAAYRAGYLPEERRALEAALQSGDAARRRRRPTRSSSGVDVTGLDAVAARRLAGHAGRRCGSRPGAPGAPARARWRCSSRATTRSTPTSCTTRRRCSAGRSRRRCSTRPTRTCSAPHLCAAAAELPLTEDDLPLFGAGRARRCSTSWSDAACCGAGPAGWFWTRPRAGRRPGRPPRRRRAAGPGRRGRHRPAARHGRPRRRRTPRCTPARSTCTRARPTSSTSLDLDERVALVHRGDPDCSTSARDDHRHPRRRDDARSPAGARRDARASARST